jgi:hypothetical protein
MLSEADARQILRGERAEAIVDIVDSAWDAHLQERRARSRRTRANIVWDAMSDFAERTLVSMDGVARIERYGIPLYAFDDQLVLNFKKHTDDFLTHNVATDHQDRLARQGHLDGLPGIVRVTCGYVLDAAEAGVSQIVTVRRVADTLEWWIDMRELASGVLAPVTQVLPFAVTTAAPLPGIRPVARDGDSDMAK